MWKDVATHMQGKTSTQCRSRWNYKLNPKRNQQVATKRRKTGNYETHTLDDLKVEEIATHWLNDIPDDIEFRDVDNNTIRDDYSSLYMKSANCDPTTIPLSSNISHHIQLEGLEFSIVELINILVLINDEDAP
jgi:hypothetical protein